MNSFALSNVSTNVNNNFNGGKSYSANKQLQSTNTTGYNFGASESKAAAGGPRRDLNQYNAYESGMLDTRNIKRAGMEKPNGNKAMVGGVKGSQIKGPIKATPINSSHAQQEQMVFSTIQFEQNKGNGYSQTVPDPSWPNQRHGGALGDPANMAQQRHEPLGPQLVTNQKPPVSKISKASVNTANQQQMMQQRASSVSANFMHLGEADSGMLRDKDNFQTPKKSWNVPASADD